MTPSPIRKTKNKFKKRGPLVKPRDPNLGLLLKLKPKVVPNKKKEAAKRATRIKPAAEDDP